MHWLAVAGVTTAAAVLRLWNLGSIPPGLSFDEASNALDSLRILETGFRPVFVASTEYIAGREAVHLYLQAACLWLFGRDNGYIIRLASALVGTATVPLIYLLVNEMFPPRRGRQGSKWFAAIAAVLVGFSYWHIHVSRLGLRAVFFTPIEAATLYFMWRATRRDSPIASLCCGGLLSFSLMTYLAARALPLVVIPLYGVALFLRGLPRRRSAVHAALFLVGLSVASLPFCYGVVTSPDAVWDRARQVSIGTAEGVGSLLGNLVDTAKMFSISGDTSAQYNLSGRPVFRFPLDLFFYTGTILSLLFVFPKVRVKYAPALSEKAFDSLPALSLVLLLVAMLAPSFLSDRSPHFLRAIGALIPAMILTALGIYVAVRWMWGHRHRLWHAVALATLGGIIAWNISFTIYDYFFVFPNREDTYYAFDGSFIDASHEIIHRASVKRVFVDPAFLRHGTAGYMLREAPVTTFDPSSALVVPEDGAEYCWLTYNKGIEEFKALSSMITPAEPIRNRHGDEVLIGFTAAAGLNAHGFDDSQWRIPAEGVAPFTLGFALEAFALRKGARWVTNEALVPGEDVSVVLGWKARKDVVGDFIVSIRLVDLKGRLWMQTDQRPGQGSLPTNRWRAGDVVLDVYRFKVPASLPPGPYKWEVQVYDVNNREICPVLKDGIAVRTPILLMSSYVDLAPITLSSTIIPPVKVEVQECYGLKLLGYEAPVQVVPPGGQVDVHLYWQAVFPQMEDARIRLALTNLAGKTIASLEEGPVDDCFSLREMAPNQILHDIHRLLVDRRAVDGPSTLEVTLLGNSDAPCFVVTLPGPLVEGRQRTFAQPRMPSAEDALFGNQIRLLGYGVTVECGHKKGELATLPASASPGSRLNFAFAWQAEEEPQVSYTVFLQLLNEEGGLVSQDDSLPVEGAAPTNSWLRGEIVSDEATLLIPKDAAPGYYSVIVGLYDARTGERLPVDGTDYVLLGRIKVLRP